MRAAAVGLAALAATTGVGRAATCPARGASLQVMLQPAAGATPPTALVFGTLAAPSCDDDGRLAGTYTRSLTCQPDTPDGCTVTFDGLRPGMWKQRILVTDGEASGQLQGRAQLLLDRSAGLSTLAWPVYRSVRTVASLDDAPLCAGCLRAAITAAEAGSKPALIQFALGLTGSIGLNAALPSLVAGNVTIDGLDTDGTPFTRTIDGNGRNAAALHIVGEHNQILGLRAINVGGDSDVILFEGPGANDNLLDSVQIVGRSAQPCGMDASGCMIDGVCREPTPQTPHGFCGDDGIAVRLSAGTAGPNRIRRCVVSAAHDKGIKASDGGVAVVEDSIVVGNVDGGVQATLSGQITARRNLLLANHGTSSANGLAVNGAATGTSVAAQLETRGNLSIGNALRGISVRGLSVAKLRDDFLCGNGTLGVAVLNASGQSALADASGLAVVLNHDGGVVVSDSSHATFGSADVPGANAVAFNGPPAPRTPVNFSNLSAFPIAAIGNLWQHCGARTPCDIAAVAALDIFTAGPQASVAIAPAQPTRRRATPRVTAIEPPFASAGELVRIYGSGFDALDGAGSSCDAMAAANTCHPLHGDCVLVDHTPADVVAVTPTMLVVRAPFTCVAPVPLHVRTRWGHGFGDAEFCVAPPADAAN